MKGNRKQVIKELIFVLGKFGEAKERIGIWFTGQDSPPPPPQPPGVPNLKNNLPKFTPGCEDPGENFWAAFPKRGLPDKPSSVIDVDAFKSAIEDVADKMSDAQRRLADQVLSDLRIGTDTLIETSRVPSEIVGNKFMAPEAEISCADQLATLVKEGIVCGPFDSPPMEGFRSNPLFVIERNNKFRLILDLSSPTGTSFNDAIDKAIVPKISTATPREIADQLLEHGDTAFMSKLDHKSAFKLVPVRADLVRFQGFAFKGKFFIETQLVFGGRTSPALYDRLHEVFLIVVQIRSSALSEWLNRCLDDFAPVTPDRESNERIVDAYVSLANDINLPLAPLDNPEKAFLVQQRGVVLGIEFDARSSSWRLPSDKGNRHRRVFQEVMESDTISCKQAERMLGMTQSVTSMIPILKALTFPLLEAVQQAKGPGFTRVTSTLKKSAWKWLNIYHDLLEWRPISHPTMRAPLTSPAIGVAQISDKRGRYIGVAISGRVPSRLIWPECLRKQVFSGDSTKLVYPSLFLQTVGLLCAIWIHGRDIRDSHFVCKVDAPMLATIWRKGRDKKCQRTSRILETIALMLVHLDAFPDVVVETKDVPLDAPPAPIPEAVRKWLRHMRPAFNLPQAMVNELTDQGVVTPI